ncbi:MAG: XRE family transcriptional regulator [Synergistales bacterium]|nr:XRE family transcriptional regulator [Synergistales bacterium]
MKLAEYRTRAGLSRMALSKTTGIPYRTLCRWENEPDETMKTIQGKRLNRVCAVLGIEPEDLADFLSVESEQEPERKEEVEI